MAPPSVDHMHTLKLDNVPSALGVDELKEMFGEFGEVGDVYIPRARGSREPRGFAFVRFLEKQAADDAIAGMDGKDVEGQSLRVQFARQKRPSNPKDYYARRGNPEDGNDRYADRRDRRDRSYRDDRRYPDDARRSRHRSRSGSRSRGSSYHERRSNQAHSRSRSRDRHRSSHRRDKPRDRSRSRSRSREDRSSRKD